jgi:hypothetical protein
MKLIYLKVESLPKFSWCAVITRHQKECKVFHGAEVEVHEDFFAEGAWKGDFNASGLLKATTICGTAACVKTHSVQFFSSSDTLSPLFSIQTENIVFISNSPTFTLSASGLEPNALHPFYAYDFVRIFQSGLNCQSGHLPTNTKYHLKIHFHSLVNIDSSLEISITSHPLEEAPVNYSSYIKLLQGTFNNLINNSSDTRRRLKYETLALVSRGYDSVATACLAAEAGCKEAVSFTNSHKSNPNQDSGKDIAVSLGMSCAEYDRWGYLNNADCKDYEFAFSTIATNPAISLLGNKLNGKILIGGTFGGLVWEFPHTIAADNLIRPDVARISAFSQIEYRLRVGYQIFAPAMICSRHNRFLASLSISDEMKPWSVGGHYDKPIARRIAEESGIERNAFGIKKMASGHAHFYDPNDLSQTGLREYEYFLNDHLSKQSILKIIFKRILFCLEKIFYKSWFGRHKDMSCLDPNRFRFTALDGSRHDISWKFSFMFQWAFESLKSRYKLPCDVSIKIMPKIPKN